MTKLLVISMVYRQMSTYTPHAEYLRMAKLLEITTDHPHMTKLLVISMVYRQMSTYTPHAEYLRMAKLLGIPMDNPSY